MGIINDVINDTRFDDLSQSEKIKTLNKVKSDMLASEPDKSLHEGLIKKFEKTANDAYKSKKYYKDFNNQALQYPAISPEFAGVGLLRAGQGVVGSVVNKFAPKAVPKAEQMVRGGMGFTQGSIAGDAGADLAIKAVEGSTSDEWKQEHPLLNGGIAIGASLLGGGLAGYKAEMAHLKDNPLQKQQQPIQPHTTPENDVKIAEGLSSTKSTKDKTNAELLNIIKRKTPKVQPQHALEKPFGDVPQEPNFVMRPNNPPTVYEAPAPKVYEQPDIDTIKIVEGFVDKDKFGSASNRIAKIQAGNGNQKDLEWFEQVKQAIPKDSYTKRQTKLAEIKRIAQERKAQVEAEAKAEAQAKAEAEAQALRDEAQAVFANGGNALGGTLGGAALGATESVSDGEVTTEELLTKMGLGALGGRYLGKRFGGDAEGVGMFVGAKPKDKGAFSDIHDKGTRKWVDDTGAKIKGVLKGEDVNIYGTVARGYSAKLGDILEHKELFEQYPKLRDITISNTTSNSSYNGLNGGWISLSSNKYANLLKKDKNGDYAITDKGKETILHELQHAIQDKEKWAKGGNPSMFKEVDNPSYHPHHAEAKREYEKITQSPEYKADVIAFEKLWKRDFKDKYDVLDAEFDNGLITIDKWEEKLKKIDHLKEEAEKQFTTLHKANTLFDNMKGYPKEKLSKHEQYLRLAGEQEARAVQAKLKHPDKTPYEALKAVEGEVPQPIVKFDSGEALSKADSFNPNPKKNLPTANGEDITMMHGGGAWLTKKSEDAFNKLVQKTAGGIAKGTYRAADYVAGGRITKAWEALKDSDAIDWVVGHKIYEKLDYMKFRDEMVSMMNKNMVHSEALHRQLSLLNEDTSKDLYRYMNGDKSIKLHPSIKQFADEYIAKIDEKGKQLVDLGVLEQAQFDKYKGRYLHRRYMKDISKGLSEANPFSKGKTIQGVHGRGNTWQGTKAEYEQLLKDGKLGDFFEGGVEARKLANGKYEFTQDWTKEQRAKWGEVEDIAYSLPETLARLDDMIANATLLKKVAEGTGYVLDDVDDTIRSGYKQLNGKKYGALNKKWVTNDVANDIDEWAGQIFGKQDQRMYKIREAARTYISLWKSSHTLYNPKAHINNLFSNVTIQVMEGINPTDAVINAIHGFIAQKRTNRLKDLVAKELIGLTKEEKAEMAKLADNDDIKLYVAAEEAGVFGRSQLNDILYSYINKTTPEQGIKSGLQSGAKKVHEIAGNLYQGEDNIMRFSLLKALMKKGEPFENAVYRVNNTIPDYSKPMSEAAKLARGSGVIPFISWTYYSMPILLRQMKERPARAMAIMVGLYSLYQSFGIDPTNEEDMPIDGFSFRRFPIAKNGSEITTLKGDKWIPHAELANPIEFLRGFVGLGVWQPAFDLVKNHNSFYNQKITNKDGWNGRYQKAKFGVQNVLPMPDILDQVYNLAESKIASKHSRRRNNVVTPRSTAQELLNLAGFNVLSYDKREQRDKVRREKVKQRKKR